MAGTGPWRLLLVHNTLAEIGGAETNFWAEIRAMRGRGHDVRVFGFTSPSEPPPVEDARSIAASEPTTQLGRWLAKFSFALGAYQALRRAVREHRPDVVHLHMNTKYPLAVLMALRGQVVVQSLHSGGMFCPSGWLIHADDMQVCPGGEGLQCIRHGCIPAVRLPAYLFLLGAWRAMARRVVDVYLPPSRHLAEMLRSFRFPRVHRLPYFSPVEMREAGAPPENHRVLFVGVVIPAKGVHSLVRAMPRVVERVADARLVVIGDGESLEECKALADSLGVAKSVDFLGRLPNEQLAEHYADAQVCAIPSVWLENSPLVAYEAMAAGRPIVGSDRGGIPDLIRSADCGVVHKAQDPDEIADGILELLENPERARELGANGRRFTRENLSEAVFCDQLEALWAGLVSDRPPLSGPAGSDPRSGERA